LVSNPRAGEQKLTALTGHSLAELLRHWSIALHRGELGGLELNGSVGRQELNGLRRREWSNLEEPHTVELKGTAVACVRLQPQAARRIVITPSSGARLQVTLNLPEAGRNRSSADAGQVAKAMRDLSTKKFSHRELRDHRESN
jgi:hypothetical protein